jgi:predicted ATPase/class 3 adenylate cyclase
MLFSDIEGSTALLSRLGDGYGEALDGQRRILRQAWADHGGVEMGTEGDSFFVVFTTAPAAVAAAVQAQRALATSDWPGGELVRVRMGIHTGSPTVHDGGYVGMDVHRAARISAAAHGGQVLLSAATVELVADGLPGDVKVRDLGLHRLKDIPRAERLYQLDVDGLASDFPAPRTLGNASSLPAPATSLVGREGELGELTALLSSVDVRLVTLTGPGGIGKTRLAIAVAGELAARFPDGVYFVDVSANETTEGFWSSVAIAVDAPREAVTTPLLFEHLGPHSLVVLDNLEQLADADTVVAELLNGAPEVRVLATSRRALLLPGEHVHPVPPLELPGGLTTADVERSGAVQLFVRRAQMVRPGFGLTEANMADVSEICHRLDGLPLALNLAAARMRLLSPKALLARMDAALDISAAGRTGPERHNTLREAIAWSYRLLDHDQQRLFRSLAVFRGGADLDAVEALCGSDAVDALAALVDASMVLVLETADGDTRIALFMTIRAFAWELATAQGETAELSKRHLLHFLEQATSRGKQLLGPEEVTALAWFELELDNLRAALDWVLGLEPGELAAHVDGIAADVALSAALRHFWGAAGLAVEGRRWLARAVGRPGRDESPDLVHCLLSLSELQMLTGEADQAWETSERARDIADRLGDDVLLAAALAGLARDAPVGDALLLARQAVETARRSGEQRPLMYALSVGVLAAQQVGDFDEALSMAEESYTLADQLNEPFMALKSRHNAAYVLYASGEPAQALERMLALVPMYLSISWPISIAAEDIALCLGDLGDRAEAARLIGSADAHNAQLQIVRHPSQDLVVGEAARRGRESLGEEWQRRYDEGQRTSVPDALRHAAESARVPTRQDGV